MDFRQYLDVGYDIGRKWKIMPMELSFVLGNEEILKNIIMQRPYEIFAEQTIEFLDALSVALRSDRTAHLPDSRTDVDSPDSFLCGPATTRRFSDVAAFGFWCRRAGVLEMKKDYCAHRYRVGRGVSLHFVSSNIPTLFGYSMAVALLAGDCVLMRLPSKRTPQEDVMVDALRSVMEKMPVWKERIVLFRSPHDKEVTDALSAMCDVRVIWGGNLTVQEIRQSPLQPRALELSFADRRSLAVFSAAAVLAEADLTAIVRAFYNDTYRNDQNACSSPHLLFWLGEDAEVKQAKERLWDAVENEIRVVDFAGQLSRKHSKVAGNDVAETGGGKKLAYQIQPALAVKKWEQALYLAAQIPQNLKETMIEPSKETEAGLSKEAETGLLKEAETGISRETETRISKETETGLSKETGMEIPGKKKVSAVRISRRGNLAILVDVEPEALSPQIWEETVPGGFFFQSSGTDVTPLFPVLSRKVQTITCFGVNRQEVAGQLAAAGVTGVDRIVEAGHALDFSLVWDGMDLIGQMSREIRV